MTLASREMYAVFDARRVKAPELRGLDQMVHSLRGYVKNRRPHTKELWDDVHKVSALEPEIKNLGAERFREAVNEMRDLARLKKLEGDALIRAFALCREGCWRACGKRPYDVQILGAMAMNRGAIAEMATGEGKTLTASLITSVWAWAGKPVHVITVNDYLVQRDAEEMEPIYKMLGVSVGHILHDMDPQARFDHYRRGAVYTTSKELVADFLRDQIQLGNLRTATQTVIGGLMEPRRQPLLIPGLFRTVVDEADSLLIDEAVTPLIISDSPDDNPNTTLYKAAHELAMELKLNRDFKIDGTVRSVDLTARGQERLEELSDHTGFWKGKRRREELVTQALTANYCFHRDEHYLVDHEGKVQIIDEFTGRIMADRSWRHGLHQAIEVKESVTVTADKENLASLSFQRFFRQFPMMAGMTGTAWEAVTELWQIYTRYVIKVPTNKPCIRVQLPTRMFDTADEKWKAVVDRICELNDKGVPILVGTRSVGSSEEVSRRLTAAGRKHRVLNAAQNAEEAAIISEAGNAGHITVATNMAGRGTDIKLSRDVAELGGLHVIATEPHGSFRVDRQLYGRAARQGDPGCAQLFCSAEDDLFLRHANYLRKSWRRIGADRLIKIAQRKAEGLARFNRKQVLKNDDWMDQSLPF